MGELLRDKGTKWTEQMQCENLGNPCKKILKSHIEHDRKIKYALDNRRYYGIIVIFLGVMIELCLCRRRYFLGVSH